MDKYFNLLLKKTSLNSEAEKKWIEQQDISPFLEQTENMEYVPVYLSNNDETGFLMHSFFISLDKIKNAKNVYDGREASCYDNFWSWGYSHKNNKREYEIFQDRYGDLEPLSFIKSFDARHHDDGKTYHELSQKLTQILDIHYLPHKQAYCIYDPEGSGELIEVIKLHPSYNDNEWEKKNILLFKKDFLDFYLWITKSALVRWWDCTRIPNYSAFDMWSNNIQHKEISKTDFYCKIHLEENCSYSSGIQIIRCSKSEEEMQYFVDNDFILKTKNYATFITNDWKNEKVHEVTCNPKHLSNYFSTKENNYPFEISPAFFKPDVLLKYKNDPDKYELTDSHIYCKNGWNLKSYDFNQKTNQISVYLLDLSKLAHQEQLYWKSYNEEPKGGISEGAFRRHFKGEFYDDETPISGLKKVLKSLSNKHPEIWDSFSDIENFSPLFSNSIEEWGNDISNLYNIVIHKMRPSEIKKIYKNIKIQEPDKDWGSIKLIEEILKEKLGDVSDIIQPLHEVRNIRNSTGGHKNNKRIVFKEKAEKEFSSLQNHLEDLIIKLTESIRKIMDNIPNSHN